MRIELDEQGFLFKELKKIANRSKDENVTAKVTDEEIRFLAVLAIQIFIETNQMYNSLPDRTDETVGAVMLSKAKVKIESEGRLPVRAIDIMDHMVPTKE